MPLKVYLSCSRWGTASVPATDGSGAVPDMPPHEFRQLLLALTKENKQKRQLALGQQPTYRVKQPKPERAKKHGFGPAYYHQYQANSWDERGLGPVS